MLVARPGKNPLTCVRGSDRGVGWRMWWRLDTRTQRLRTWARVGHQPSKFLMFGSLGLACSGDNRWRRGWEGGERVVGSVPGLAPPG